jgi:ankyrin repeat protein
LALLSFANTQLAQRNNLMQLCQLLLLNGMDLSVQNELGETVLVLALKYKLLDIVELILG